MVLDSELPHLIGIDDDLLSTGIILYHLKVRLHLLHRPTSRQIYFTTVFQPLLLLLAPPFRKCVCAHFAVYPKIRKQIRHLHSIRWLKHVTIIPLIPLYFTASSPWRLSLSSPDSLFVSVSTLALRSDHITCPHRKVGDSPADCKGMRQQLRKHHPNTIGSNHG